MRPVMFCLSQASVVLGWGRVGWEKQFRDMALAVSKSRIYRSSQRSLVKAEAVLSPPEFSLPFPALLCSCAFNRHMFSISHMKTDCGMKIKAVL